MTCTNPIGRNSTDRAVDTRHLGHYGSADHFLARRRLAYRGTAHSQ
jgi:hypothetical protein